MAYNTKEIKKDSRSQPIPQVYNPASDDFEPLYGSGNASRHVIYGPDGNPIITIGNKLAVRATELENLIASLGGATEAKQDVGNTSLSTISGKDFATQATLAAILAKIIAAPSTEAKQDIGNTSLSTIASKDFATQTTLAALLAKVISAPATEAKQDAGNASLSSILTQLSTTGLKKIIDPLPAGTNEIGKVSITGSSTNDITFHDAAIAAADGTILTVSGYKTLTVEIYGTSTSRTIAFIGRGPSGTDRAVMGVKLSDLSTGAGTNGTGEIWQFDITGLTSFFCDLQAVAGGNVTVKGRAVA